MRPVGVDISARKMSVQQHSTRCQSTLPQSVHMCVFSLTQQRRVDLVLEVCGVDGTRMWTVQHQCD